MSYKSRFLSFLPMLGFFLELRYPALAQIWEKHHQRRKGKGSQMFEWIFGFVFLDKSKQLYSYLDIDALSLPLFTMIRKQPM